MDSGLKLAKHCMNFSATASLMPKDEMTLRISFCFFGLPDAAPAMIGPMIFVCSFAVKTPL